MALHKNFLQIWVIGDVGTNENFSLKSVVPDLSLSAPLNVAIWSKPLTSHLGYWPAGPDPLNTESGLVTPL